MLHLVILEEAARLAGGGELDEEAVEAWQVLHEGIEVRRQREDGDVVEVHNAGRHQRRVVRVLLAPEQRAEHRRRPPQEELVGPVDLDRRPFVEQ